MDVLAIAFCLALALSACGGSAPRSTQSPAKAPPPISLIAPRGEIDEVPGEFSWGAIPGAVEYTIKIADDDAIWPLIVKTVKATHLTLTEKERAAITPGRIHIWELEGKDARGAAIATGEARFLVRPSGEPAL